MQISKELEDLSLKTVNRINDPYEAIRFCKRFPTDITVKCDNEDIDEIYCTDDQLEDLGIIG